MIELVDVGERAVIVDDSIFQRTYEVMEDTLRYLENCRHMIDCKIKDLENEIKYFKYIARQYDIELKVGEWLCLKKRIKTDK